MLLTMLKKFLRPFWIMILLTFLILIIPIHFLFYSQNTNPTQNKIITTTTMLNDAVKHLLGDVDEQENKDSRYQNINSISCLSPLMGVGIDPHNYKIKLSDRKKIKNADLIILNGLHLEAKMISAIELLKNVDNIWKAGEESLDDADKLKGDVESSDVDPHIWFDIDLWIKVIEKLKEKIAKILTTNEDKEKLEVNCHYFKEDLSNLKKHIIKELTELKSSKEQEGNKLIIVTAHDAFSYWENFSHNNECDFQLKSIQGVSTQTEANMRQIIDLAQELVENNVKAIFTESSMPKTSLESLKEEINNLRKSKGLEPIQIPENIELYSDSLGKDDQIEELNNNRYKHSTYIGAFLNNMKIIKAYV
ncbi:MAG: zinc ABC transporter substrate-binding protein [Vigna little leaf phytoplasma]|nr:zinc ABC transporter substrate-binding protein [Vigna little leaf phytoplasma]